MDPRSSFEQILQNLPNEQIDIDLLSKTREWLKTGTKEDKVKENVVEELSKYTEIFLRDLCEEFTKQNLTGKARSGFGLVGALIDSGLIQEQDNGNLEPMHFLLRWYFSERNPSHHENLEYSFNEFLNYYLVSNYLVLEFSKRTVENPRSIAMVVNLNPAAVPLGNPVIITASMNNPTTGTPFTTGNVTVRAVFPNDFQTERKMSFSITQNVWEAQVSTSGAIPGEYTVRIIAVAEDERFISQKPKKGKITSR